MLLIIVLIIWRRSQTFHIIPTADQRFTADANLRECRCENPRKWSLDLLPQPRPYPTPQAHPFSKFWTHHITCTCCLSTVTVWSLTAHTYRQPLSVLGVNVLRHERKMNAATDKVSLTQQRPEMFYNNAWFASSKRGPKQYSLYATKLV